MIDNNLPLFKNYPQLIRCKNCDYFHDGICAYFTDSNKTIYVPLDVVCKAGKQLSMNNESILSEVNNVIVTCEYCKIGIACYGSIICDALGGEDIKVNKTFYCSKGTRFRP